MGSFLNFQSIAHNIVKRKPETMKTKTGKDTNRRKAVKRKSIGWSEEYSDEILGTHVPQLVGWTPHPTIKLVVGEKEEEILIHRKIIKDLNLDCPATKDPVSIPIRNVDPQHLRILLNYIYNDELNITTENVWSILVTSWQFDHANAQTLCIDFIIDNMMRFDCWEMWRSARMYEMKELIAAVENYTSRHLGMLKTGASFLKLSFTEIMDFFKSEEVCKASSRETRCQAAITWIEFNNTDERLNNIPALISTVDLENLPPRTQDTLLDQHSVFARMWTDLRKELEDLEDDAPMNVIRVSQSIFETDQDIEDVVFKMEENNNLDKEINVWPTSEDDIILDSDLEDSDLTDIADCDMLPSIRYPPASSNTDDTLIVISGKEDNGYRSVWSYDIKTRTTTLLADVEARINDTFLCRNNVLYHMGGRKGDVVTKDVYSLKLLSQQMWEPCPPMTVSRCYFCAVVMKGDIYAIGGNIGEGDLVMNTVDVLKFDGELRSNAWDTIPFLNRSRDAFGAAVDEDDTIYVVGGCGQLSKSAKCSSVLALAEEYAGAGCLWMSSRRMRQKRMFHGLVFLRGNIYAIGGFDGDKVLGSMECFDGNCNGKWIQCASMQTARKEMSTIVLGGRIYVFGGTGDNDEPINSSEVYDPATKLWSTSDILPTNEGPFHCVLVKC